MEPDISTLRKTGHFYFALTRGRRRRLNWNERAAAFTIRSFESNKGGVILSSGRVLSIIQGDFLAAACVSHPNPNRGGNVRSASVVLCVCLVRFLRRFDFCASCPPWAYCGGFVADGLCSCR